MFRQKVKRNCVLNNKTAVITESEYENYREILEDNRDCLVKSLDCKQFFAKLRTAGVFNVEDEQSVTHNIQLLTDAQKAGAFLDKLATKGQMGFKVFLNILETRYPELYKQLSGKDAVRQPETDDIPLGDTCQEHSALIKSLAASCSETAEKVEKYKKENEFLKHKILEVERLNNVLKAKHNKNMMKLQRFDSMEQTLNMKQHELHDLSTQQRNIFAKSLELQQEKEAIQRKLRSANVEITDLKHQLKEAIKHHERKSQIMQSSRQSNGLPNSSSFDAGRSMEVEIERLRRELETLRESNDVDVEVGILRDDLREKTTQCERLVDEWQQTQRDLESSEDERIMAVSELEDARYECQNYKREAARFKQLYELSIKHSDRTEEDLKKAREDRNSLETHVDLLLREQRDLLYRLQDLQNKNMTLSHDNSVLARAAKKDVRLRKKGGTPDLGYAGGSQSESSKEGSPRNSFEDPKTSSVQGDGSSCKSSEPKKNPRKNLRLNMPHSNNSMVANQQFRRRAKPLDPRSPRPRLSGNNYASLRKEDSVELNNSDSSNNLSCSSLESISDQENCGTDANELSQNRLLFRQRKGPANLSIEAHSGSTRNRYTLTCFGISHALDDVYEDKENEIKEDDYDDEDIYDYPEVMKRRSMSLTDLTLLSRDYEFVDFAKPICKQREENVK